jgi:hypothetical protein
MRTIDPEQKFFGADDAIAAGKNAVDSRMENHRIAAGASKMSPVEGRCFRTALSFIMCKDPRKPRLPDHPQPDHESPHSARTPQLCLG